MRRRASGAAARVASMRWRTVHGSATPMVSPRAISPTPSAAASRTMATTWSSATSPSNGQPNATEMVSEIGGPPSASRRATMAARVATCSATEAPWLRMPKPSVAQTTTLASSQPLATARSQPRSLSTRPMREPRDRRQGGHDLLGPGHLRHAAGIDEGHRLDPPRAAGLQAADELDLVVDVQDRLLVLQPVAGADFDDFDARLMARASGLAGRGASGSGRKIAGCRDGLFE